MVNPSKEDANPLLEKRVFRRVEHPYSYKKSEQELEYIVLNHPNKTQTFWETIFK